MFKLVTALRIAQKVLTVSLRIVLAILAVLSQMSKEPSEAEPAQA